MTKPLFALVKDRLEDMFRYKSMCIYIISVIRDTETLAKEDVVAGGSTRKLSVI